MNVEQWLFEKAREDDKDVQLSHLYTAEFMFGGRWVMDLLEEYAQLYHEQELSKLHQPTVIGTVCECTVNDPFYCMPEKCSRCNKYYKNDKQTGL
jgi:hypothetical protein